MRLKFADTALPPSSDLRDSIKRIISTAQNSIVHLCRKFYCSNSRELQKKLEDIKEGLQQKLCSSEYLHFMDTLKKCEKRVDRQCFTTKRKKLRKLLQAPEESTVPQNGTESKRKKNRHFRRRPAREPEPGQVINLSSTTLTAEQTQLLSYGPKFCPTPGTYDEAQLLDDVKEGVRKVRLREYWYEEDAPAQLPSTLKFYKKTHWEPPKDRDQALEAYSSSLQTMVTSYTPHFPPHRNISKNSRQALLELKRLVMDRTIRITPADKGGSVVVQDFSQYHQEALRQLNNIEHYESLSTDPTVDIAKTSNNLLRKLHEDSIIDDKTQRWGLLDEKNVKTHTFYHLPKVHKNAINPPGRPIVSGVGGPTEKLSKLADHWIQPVVQRLPSYLKDTTHLLRVLQEWNTSLQPLLNDALIVTIDVVALYPSIPHAEVATSLTDMLQDPAHPKTDGPPLQTLLEIVEHVLTNNVFKFDGQLYRQVQGTAMGTPMAPSVANVFMGWLEQRLLSTSPWPVDPKLWRRYIDDILLLWTHGEHQLKDFLEWLNSQHPTIKFTSNYGQSDIPFLDVSISIRNGVITTDVHTKPTDANMLLPFHSCHPRHCMRGIPRGQALRLRRICSEDETFMLRCRELQERLIRRGYPKPLLEAAIAKAAATPRERALDYTNHDRGLSRVPFIITHNPSHPPLSKWLKDLMPVLHSSRRMKKAMPHPPIVGERNCKNLKSLLMPSRLPQPQPPHSQESGCKKCTAKRCVLCANHLQEGNTFSSVRTGSTYNIRDSVGCKSSNVIYLINCSCCAEVQYVGETGQTVSKRFHAHRSSIRSRDRTGTEERSPATSNTTWRQETLVARHFQGRDHSLADMKVVVIEQINQDSAQVRKARERFWRHKLRTNYPQGLNVWD